MSEDKKSAFGEATVVHAFDANTVVHAKPLSEKKPVTVETQTNVDAKVMTKEERAAAKAKVNAANKLRFRLVVAGIFSALTLAVLLSHRESSKTQASQPTVAEAKATELASEAAPVAKSKFSDSVDANEILTKFDKAFGAAQQRAFEPAR